MKAPDGGIAPHGTCPSCGGALSAGKSVAAGESAAPICVRCALGYALSDSEDPHSSAATLDQPGSDSPDPSRPITGPAARGRIGPYLLRRVLGEGGMGIVWEAEQQEPVRRRVALKCIRVGLDGGQFQARFESERQALALMSHPNIARAFDAGCTQDGQPYYAMEMVDGPWITRFCDEQRLDVRQRLELFIEVCRGIQHAHQRGVIHRDIKPSNILIQMEEGRPVPKVIDFGVAKAMGALLTDRTLVTRMGQMVGTPEYMSPEQAGPAGFDVDTRTDVYSLGTLLYELLTGELAFGTADGDPDSLRRRIREEEPVRPSARVAAARSRKGDAGAVGGGDAAAAGDGKAAAIAAARRTQPAALSRALRGDLDWIVLKALAKDRARRYATPDDLAADVGRFLAHEPVLAGPPSTLYRAWKFVRRHRFGVSAAALATAGVVTFGVAMAVQTRTIARERDRAERVSQFLVQTFQGSDPEKVKGKEPTAREILDRGAGRIDKELGNDPEVQAQLLHTLGHVYRNLGHYARSEELLGRSLEIRRRALGNEHPDTLVTMEQLALVYQDDSRYPEAEVLQKETVDRRSRTLGPKHPDTLRSRTRLATVYERQGRFNESEKLYEEVLAIQRQVLAKDDEALFESLDCVAASKMHRGQYAEAERLFREEVEGRTRVSGPDYPWTLWAMNNLGYVYMLQRRWDEAEELHTRILAIRRRVLGDEHPRTLSSIVNLAKVYEMKGRQGEAARLLQDTLEVRRRTLGPEHQNTLSTVADVARLFFKLGRKAEAEGLWKEALASQERLLGPEHPETLATMNDFADLSIDQGRYDEAVRLLRRTVEGMRRTLGPGHPGLATPLRKMAVVTLLRGERTAALDWARQALEQDPREAEEFVNDPRLVSLQGDQDFTRLLVASKGAAVPASVNR